MGILDMYFIVKIFSKSISFLINFYLFILNFKKKIKFYVIVLEINLFLLYRDWLW